MEQRPTGWNAKYSTVTTNEELGIVMPTPLQMPEFKTFNALDTYRTAQSIKDHRTQNKLYEAKMARQEDINNMRATAGEDDQSMMDFAKKYPKEASQLVSALDRVDARRREQGVKLYDELARDAYIAKQSPQGQMGFTKKWGEKFPWVSQVPLDDVVVIAQGAKGIAKKMSEKDSGKAPTTRTIYNKGQTIQQEWDPKQKKWNQVGSGPRWQPAQDKERPTALQRNTPWLSKTLGISKKKAAEILTQTRDKGPEAFRKQVYLSVLKGSKSERTHKKALDVAERAVKKFYADVPQTLEYDPARDGSAPAVPLPTPGDTNPQPTPLNEPTATNPQTGEKMVLREGQWVPLK